MEKVDPMQCSFVAGGMVPDAGDELTVPWGRHLVYNLVSGYGMVGTVVLPSKSRQSFNLGLTQKFKFPPMVYCYVDSLTGLQEIPRQNYAGLQYPYNLNKPTVGWMINGDVISFHNWLSYDFGITTSLTVYFRIHGV